MDLTNEDVADILALLDSLPYDSLDIETPRFRLTLRRAPGGGWTEESQVLAEPVPVSPAPNGASAKSAFVTSARDSAHEAAGTESAQGGAGAQHAREAAALQSAPRAARAGRADDAAGAADADGLAVVAAPLPGTFYRAPRPGAEPFVQVGDTVTPDTVVAIVETMKLMNSVHAGTTGRVARICVGNGEFASLGTTLMLIEPAT